MLLRVQSSQLTGTLTCPPSKSQTIRALLFASIAMGESTIFNVLQSPDVDAMIAAMTQFGAQITREVDTLTVQGFNRKPLLPSDSIDAGNSGLVLRFATMLAALCEQPIMITGDESIRHSRPLAPLLQGLSHLGANCLSHAILGQAPVTITGPIQAGHTQLQGQDSQPVSALLVAAALLEGDSEITVTHPGEKPWVSMTLEWLSRLGIPYQQHEFERYRVSGGQTIPGFAYTVTSDFSSLAFPLVAALATQSSLIIEGMDFNDAQGDKQLIDMLIEMGAQISIDNDKLFVRPSQLRGARLDVNACIDALPILAVVGTIASGTTTLHNARIARHKESDRIAAMATELRKMGAEITQQDDGLVIKQSQLKGAAVHSHHDHRIAMSLAVAGFIASGHTELRDGDCIAKSYPAFAEQFQQLGANIEVLT